MTLHYYRQAIVDDYFDHVEQNLDWYYEPNGQAPKPKETYTTRSAPIEARDLSKLLKPQDTRPSETDADNALLVYEALDELSPHQATDERLWAYLCHNSCSAYVAWRWLGRRPDGNEGAAKKVRNHFFARGTVPDPSFATTASPGFGGSVTSPTRSTRNIPAASWRSSCTGRTFVRP